MKKQVLLVIIILLMAIIFISLSLFFKVDNFSITTIKKQYNFINKYEETQEMEVLIYVSNKKTYFVDKTFLEKTYIKTENNSDLLELELLKISDKNITSKISNTKYHLYTFLFRINLKTSSEFLFETQNAILELNYKSNIIEINIGSFYYKKIPYYGDSVNALSIFSLKGIVNKITTNKTLQGVVIGIRNDYSKKITIHSIKALEANISFSLSDLVILEEDVSSNTTLDYLLGYKYNFYTNIKETNTFLSLEKNQELTLLIPLKYYTNLVVSNIGFLIEFKIDGKSYTYYHDDFYFFNDNKYYVDVSLLDILYYENS